MAGENEGATGEEGGEKKEEKDDGKVMNQLAEALQTLATDLSGVKQTITELKEAKPLPKNDDDEEEEEEVDDADLESMSRKDFLKVVVKAVESKLGKEIQSVKTSAQKTSEEVERDRIRTQVAEVAEKNPDFWDWAEEVKSIANETPGISVKRAYALAKQENPEKAKQLAEKYKAKDGDKHGSGDADKSGSKPRKLGGLLPTSGSEAPSQKMDKRTAAEKAWDSVVPSGALAGE